MIITNLTSDTFYIGGSRLSPAPGTLTVSDYDYNNVDAVANQINYLDEAGHISIASPPSGYPRSTSESSGGGASSASDLTFTPAGTIAATNVQDALEELDSEASAGAMVQLYDNVASGAIASWDVSGISQAYNHLMILMQARGSSAATEQDGAIRFNNDSAANYEYKHNVEYGSNAIGGSEDSAATLGLIGRFQASTASAGRASTAEVSVPNYAGTTFFKGYHAHNFSMMGTGGSERQINNVAGQWRSTAAITRITVYPTSGNFVAGSRLTIYGLL